jgi:hypothetical protein
MEQREKSVGADVSAMPELTRDVSRDVTDVPERHRARTAVAVDTSVNTRAAENTAARAREKGSRERDKDTDSGDKGKKSSVRKNRLRETRIEKMMSKAELARRAKKAWVVAWTPREKFSRPWA